MNIFFKIYLNTLLCTLLYWHSNVDGTWVMILFLNPLLIEKRNKELLFWFGSRASRGLWLTGLKFSLFRENLPYRVTAAPKSQSLFSSGRQAYYLDSRDVGEQNLYSPSACCVYSTRVFLNSSFWNFKRENINKW